MGGFLAGGVEMTKKAEAGVVEDKFCQVLGAQPLWVGSLESARLVGQAPSWLRLWKPKSPQGRAPYLEVAPYLV